MAMELALLVCKGDIQKVEELIDAGNVNVNINALVPWSSDKTPTPVQVNGKFYEADAMEYETTVLHLAVLAGDAQMVSCLLDAGADLNLKDSLGRTPLICSIYGIDNLKLNASTLPFVMMVCREHVQVLEKLIADSRLSLTTLNGPQDALRGITPLALASYFGKEEIVTALLDGHGFCEIDALDRNGATALMYAARESRVSMVQMLLKKGASPDIIDANGCSAIQYAQDCPIIVYLCEASLRNKRHQKLNDILTELNLSQYKKMDASPPQFTLLSSFLREHLDYNLSNEAIDSAFLLANHTALVQAIRMHNFIAMESMLLMPPIFTYRDSSLADGEKDRRMLTLANHHDSASGRRPIHNAFRTKSRPAIETLIMLYQAGADMNARTQYGRTPLHYLCRFAASSSSRRSRHRSVASSNYSFTTNDIGLTSSPPRPDQGPHLGLLAKLLIHMGASVNQRDSNGFTPLMFAAQHQCLPEVIQVLLDNGADLEIRNPKGYRAIDIADPSIRHMLILESGSSGYDSKSTSITSLFSIDSQKSSNKDVSGGSNVLVPLDMHDADQHYEQIINNFAHYTTNLSNQIEVSLETFLNLYKAESNKVGDGGESTIKQTSSQRASQSKNDINIDFQRALLDVKADVRNANQFFTLTTKLCTHLLGWFKAQIEETEQRLLEIENKNITDLRRRMLALWENHMDLTRSLAMIRMQKSSPETLNQKTLATSDLAVRLNQLSLEISAFDSAFTKPNEASHSPAELLQSLSLLIGKAMTEFEAEIKDCKEKIRKHKRVIKQSKDKDPAQSILWLSQSESMLASLVWIQEKLKIKFEQASQQLVQPDEKVEEIRRASQLYRRFSRQGTIMSTSSALDGLDAISEDALSVVTSTTTTTLKTTSTKTISTSTTAIDGTERLIQNPVKKIEFRSGTNFEDLPLVLRDSDAPFGNMPHSFAKLQLEFDLLVERMDDVQQQIELTKARRKELGRLKAHLYGSCLELEAEERGMNPENETNERSSPKTILPGARVDEGRLIEIHEMKNQIMQLTELIFEKDSKLADNLDDFENEIFGFESSAAEILSKQQSLASSEILEGLLDNVDILGLEKFPSMEQTFKPDMAYCELEEGEKMIDPTETSVMRSSSELSAIIANRSLLKVDEYLSRAAAALKKGETEILTILNFVTNAKHCLHLVKNDLQQLELCLNEKLHIRKMEIECVWLLVQDMMKTVVESKVTKESQMIFDERLERYLSSKASIDGEESSFFDKANDMKARIAQRLCDSVLETRAHEIQNLQVINKAITDVESLMIKAEEDSNYARDTIGQSMSIPSVVKDLIFVSSANLQAFLRLIRASSPHLDASQENDEDLDRILGTLF